MRWSLALAKRLRGQKGFTLIEVLIAVFVLSIGLLGLAMLQMQALRSSLFSYQTSVANMIAKDAKERLWIELALPRSNESDDRFVCKLVAYSDVEGDVHADWGVGGGLRGFRDWMFP